MDPVDILVADLKHIFRGCECTRIRYDEMSAPLPSHGIAATLVVLEYIDGDWRVLLNVRAKHLRRHPGEVCFPGGMREVEDQTIVETALREAYEEIGLPSENVRVCSVLKPFMSRYGIPMHPVIAILTKPFVPFCSEEVEKVFYSPLKAFLQKENHTYKIDYIEDKSIPAKETVVLLVDTAMAGSSERKEILKSTKPVVPAENSKEEAKL